MKFTAKYADVPDEIPPLTPYGQVWEGYSRQKWVIAPSCKTNGASLGAPTATCPFQDMDFRREYIFEVGAAQWVVKGIERIPGIDKRRVV